MGIVLIPDNRHRGSSGFVSMSRSAFGGLCFLEIFIFHSLLASPIEANTNRINLLPAGCEGDPWSPHPRQSLMCLGPRFLSAYMSRIDAWRTMQSKRAQAVYSEV
jgi:hypothetical protein